MVRIQASVPSRSRIPEKLKCSLCEGTGDLVAAYLEKDFPSLPRHPDQPNDRLERSIGLQDREEHLIRALVLGRPIAERNTAEIEWSRGDGVEQFLTRGFAVYAFKRLDHESADEIAFQRDEAGFGIRVIRGKRTLIGGDDRQRCIPWRRHDLTDDDAGAFGAEFLRQGIRADERNRDEQRVHFDLMREL